MNESFRVLAINPGSTSTKIAVYEGNAPLFETTLQHAPEELFSFAGDETSLAFRRKVIEKALAEHGVRVDTLHAVIGRGGMLRPIAGGTYAVNERMLHDLASRAYGEHASNLGAPLARRIASEASLPAYIADPVATDEMHALARLSGHPEIERRSVFHALNQKAVARRFCAERKLRYEEVNLIVAHMGGGASVGAHEKGRVIDVNDGLGGDGPYSAQRCGGLPASALVKLCRRVNLPAPELIRQLNTRGGLMGYLGTDDGREIGRRARNGDDRARLAYEGMAYQVAKEIGACAAVLRGDVTAVILTGGFAHDGLITGWIAERTRFIAEVAVMPGEDELRALCEAALRVLCGEETPKEY
ncbi:MAG TPA: butyrate kinase [Clostridia bacterium]|nr:butyrate kinase [Clostridia bacterium]